MATKKSRRKHKPTDILIIVPKQDELHWIGLAFHFDFTKPDRFLPPNNEAIYDRSITDATGNKMRVSFVSMDSQGNTESALTTRESVRVLNPSLAFLIGTGLGNSKRCELGDVVFAENIIDVSQTKAFDDQITSWRAAAREPTGRMRRDVGRFLRSVNLRALQASFFDLATSHLAEHRDAFPTMPSAIHLEAVAAGDVLIASAALAQKLWEYDDRVASYDMESGGFGKALGGSLAAGEFDEDGVEEDSSTDTERRGSPEWMVIRGISDFGDPESKGLVQNRSVASAVAGIVLREFLISGLRECHPYQLRLPTDRIAGIPPGHLYAKKNGTKYFRKKILEDLGIELPSDQPNRSRTIGALAAALHPEIGMSRDELTAYLNEVRSAYFEDKYLDYTYENDTRSLLPGWSLEVRDIVRAALNLPRSGLEILDVGVGNGLELEPLFGERGVLGASSVTGVDISESMLRAAQERFPALKIVHTSAESLTGVTARSVDLYISLRTFMSRGFDVTRALEEAVRVLRPGGGIVISVANGYVVDDDRGRRLVRGLTVSGTDAVDPQKPHEIAFQIQRQLYDFAFHTDGYFSTQTDVYLWGLAPQAAARRAPVLTDALTRQLPAQGNADD